ncbi:MAG: elongation factor G [Bacillota bacterium]
MKDYVVDKLRNICLLSHGGAGKTTLTECMLYNSGVLERFGKVSDGNTTSDYDPEEVKRKISISTTLNPIEYKEHRINIIDTPGYFDFVGEVMSGIRVADGAIILVSGKNGVAVGTEKSWTYCKERNIPRFFFVNNMEDENADFDKVLIQFSEKFGSGVAAFEIPFKEDGKLVGVIDVINRVALRFEKEVVEVAIPATYEGQVEAAWDKIKEAIAETDEELMEKYFAGEEYTAQEIQTGIKKGIELGYVIPIFGGSAFANIGVKNLTAAIVEYMPSPAERPNEMATKVDSDEEVELKPLPTEPVAALVFKTIADPFVGRINFFKVFSGTLKADSSLLNTTTGKQEKMSALFMLRGKKQVNMPAFIAGDIGAVAKLTNTSTNDTLCDPSRPLKIEGVSFPAPMLSQCIAPKTKGDEEKINTGVHKLMDEDKTITLIQNTETHQVVITGMGEQHLDVVVSKLKTKFNVLVDLLDVRVPYRETIKKRIEVEGKHKKQSGGHGQYGHVKMVFEPGEAEGLTFEEKVVGGSVPKQYHPAVEKGLLESIQKGVLAGYPVVNLKAVLMDGSYHDVDSSEMAFKLAARKAYKEGLPKASPVLLEPVAHVEVNVPDEYMGDIIGDLNKRRGRIMGMNPVGDGQQQVVAEVPLAEVYKYATDLRSMTHGKGSFGYTFERYEEAPPMVAQKVIEEAKKLMVEEEED